MSASNEAEDDVSAPADVPADTVIAIAAAAADAAGEGGEGGGAIADAAMHDVVAAGDASEAATGDVPGVEGSERRDAAMDSARIGDAGSGDDAEGAAEAASTGAGAGDDENYEALMADLEKKEDKEFSEMIEAEEERTRDPEAGEAIVDADLYTGDTLEAMRSMYVTDPSGEQVHKKTILKQIGAGKTLVKSFDRNKRVRGEARKGRASVAKDNDGKVDSSVTRAYQYDGTSGDDTHKMGDYCCVLVKARTNSNQKNSSKEKPVQMLVGKLQRFGDGRCQTPQQYEWPVAKATFRASIRVCKMAQCTDADDNESVHSTGETIIELRNVNSACIVPVKPSLEETWSPEAGVPVTNAVMQADELTPIVEHLSQQKKFYESKGDTVLEPIRVNGKTPFVLANDPNAWEEELPTCNICIPPMVIVPSKSRYTATDIQRSLRNHMGRHILDGLFDYEPCAFCCNKNCHLHVEITDNNKKGILRDPKEKKIDAGAFVHPNCETYTTMEPFEYKCSKSTKAYPCSNVPVLCHACDATHFIWLYNLDKHYEKEHPDMLDREISKYDLYLMEDEATEKKAMKQLFKLAGES